MASTPYAIRPLFRQVPVGIVVRNRVTLAPAAKRYWAVGGRSDADLILFWQGSVPAGLSWAVGGFFPLVLDHQPVADQYPAAIERTTRVAIGSRDQHRCVVAAPGAMGGGMTLDEFANALAAAGYRWALNLDGGRSAYLRTAAGPVALGVRLRRRGPVLLNLDALHAAIGSR